MLSKDLKERFLKVYGEIAEVSGFFDIIMAVLRDNDGRKQKTDCFPVAEILAEKMEKLLLLPLPERRKLGMLGRKLVEETFSINKIIPQYLQVISVVFSDQKQV